MKTLTLDEAADMLKTCTETVSECIRSRGLPAVKIGRAWVLVDDDVINWLRQQYGKDLKCASIPAASAASSGSMSQSQGRELHAALEPQANPRRRNGRPNLRTIPGGQESSETRRP